ncbi:MULTISPECIES: hypothetical protein [unclassified Yimella]|uniref:hypothetical protein n=1 Tax=unclassified Yimella TaxID=2649892 RepID=UPI00101C48CB|nr:MULTISPECIES: hypothetical protein [unclassified Yimella]MCG8656668.1 hypothetical protein [Yimella sp. NH-Cas1]RYG78657.1 hypothetical protein EU513_03395 [Yimella sp. RIT 621]
METHAPPDRRDLLNRSFGLVAVIGSVLTVFNDRSFPTSLGATTSVRLDFARSSLSDGDAFHQLQTMDRQSHLGLMRVAPDLAGRGQDRVYITVGTRHAPRTITAFDPNVRSQVLKRPRFDAASF